MGDFINFWFTSALPFTLTDHPQPLNCMAFDGSPSVGGPNTQVWHSQLTMMAKDDQLFNALVSLNFTTLGNYDLILGMPWLKTHSGWVGAAGPPVLLLDPQSSPSSVLAAALLASPPSVSCSPSSLVLVISPSTSLPYQLSHFSDILFTFFSRLSPSSLSWVLLYNCSPAQLYAFL